MRLITWFCERCGYLRSWVHVCADYCHPTGSIAQEPETFAERLSRQSVEAMEAQIAADWDARNAREHAAGQHPEGCTCQRSATRSNEQSPGSKS